MCAEHALVWLATARSLRDLEHADRGPEGHERGHHRQPDDVERVLPRRREPDAHVAPALGQRLAEGNVYLCC